MIFGVVWAFVGAAIHLGNKITVTYRELLNPVFFVSYTSSRCGPQYNRMDSQRFLGHYLKGPRVQYGGIGRKFLSAGRERRLRYHTALASHGLGAARHGRLEGYAAVARA